MAEQFESHYWSGQGPVFIGRRDASGNPIGLKFIGDVSQVELTPSVDTVDVLENVTGNRNIAASFRTKVEYALAITMKSVKPEHLAEALQGSVTTKTAGTVTGEAIKGWHDAFTKLANVKVSNETVTDSTGTTTYTAGTDYILHGDEGMIEVLSTGAITDGQDLLIDYDYAAQSEVKANPQAEDLVLVFSGLNRARSSKRGRLTIHKVNLDPSALSAIVDGDQEAAMSITGKALYDDLRSAGDQLFTWDLED